jgi:DNA-binding transcriptional ArsR family regulator
VSSSNQAFRALADETRRDILRLLRNGPLRTPRARDSLRAEYFGGGAARRIQKPARTRLRGGGGDCMQPIVSDRSFTMRNPWLDIPLADYEAHMALPTIGQDRLIADHLSALIRTYEPSSVAILGCAGGKASTVCRTLASTG